MDADEKLALQKAYADIILSISKDTAARVLASERKSAMFQYELKVAREEGVRMLMRLKQMMDSQSSEAEAASLIQRKKIEELEAQLQEAEDIVRDLREELEDVQAKLERVQSENFHHPNELSNACSKEVPVQNNVSSYQSSEYLPPNESFDVMVPDLSQKNECLKCCNETVCSCDVFTGDRDLPSITVVDKDPGLYRNGCTQRIRACEDNLLDRDSCLSEETDEVKDKKNCGELKEAKQKTKAPDLVAKIPSQLEKKLLADINLGTSKSFSRKRKRASRQNKRILMLGGKQSHPSSKLDQLPEQSMINWPISVNNSTENPFKIGLQLSRYKAEPKSLLQSAKASENVRNVVEIDGSKTMCEDGGEKEKMVPLRGITEFSESSLSLKNVEKADVLSSGSESKFFDTTKGLTSQPVTVKGREIKYTYQRKRKRQALSQTEVNGSHETGKKTGDGENSDQKLEQPKSSVLKESSGDQRQCSSEVIRSGETKKKTGDGQNGVQKLEQPKSGWLEGSLREHKRMVQVARQVCEYKNLLNPCVVFFFKCWYFTCFCLCL
ncbi:hypothetical protein ACS0TY_006922 [Phlomoides rotata]